MVEQPNGDFAHTMVRQLLYSAFVHPWFGALSGSRNAGLAEIAAKAVKEMAYHVRHSAEWVIRLGDGTAESRLRTIAALDALWPYTGELFAMAAVERSLVADGIPPDRESDSPRLGPHLGPCPRRGAARPPARQRNGNPSGGSKPPGGRSGHHTQHLATMLTDMQSLARAHPGVTW